MRSQKTMNSPNSHNMMLEAHQKVTCEKTQRRILNSYPKECNEF